MISVTAYGGTRSWCKDQSRLWGCQKFSHSLGTRSRWKDRAAFGLPKKRVKPPLSLLSPLNIPLPMVRTYYTRWKCWISDYSRIIFDGSQNGIFDFLVMQTPPPFCWLCKKEVPPWLNLEFRTQITKQMELHVWRWCRRQERRDWLSRFFSRDTTAFSSCMVLRDSVRKPKKRVRMVLCFIVPVVVDRLLDSRLESRGWI
jgi:hypothetical protein